MAKTRTGIVAGLDVGSTKVSCFIAHVAADGGIRVAGASHHASDGVRQGVIVDMEEAQNAILTAVTAAEQLAGERIRSVFVNVNGGRLGSRTYGAKIAITGREVEDSDLRRVLNNGYAVREPAERAMIHCIPVGYSIDGSRGIRDPRGMFGETLAVNMHIVSAGAGALRNLATCVERCHLDIEALVAAPYAAGIACLVEDETDLGCTLVDMGGGTTTVAVFYDGNVMYADSISVGGAHVTNDIARGLSTPLVHAERMKTLYGSAVSAPSDDRELIDVPLVGEETTAHPNHVPRSMLVGIIAPRLEETFELVRSRLESSGAGALAGRRLVLTGGASQMQGAKELAALILNKQVRMGRPLRISGLPESTGGPGFSVSAGLLVYAVTKHGSDEERALKIPDGPIGRVSRIGHWLRENF
ncbi:MAG TPA: cell division protein FtsA [Alphaproteobacteria bacterium]